MTFTQRVSALFTPTLSPRAHQLCSASSWKPVFRCKWGSKMPKGFSHKKRHTAPDGPGPGRPRKPLEDDHGKQRRRCLTHSELAELMWSPFKVFEHHLRAELELYPEDPVPGVSLCQQCNLCAHDCTRTNDELIGSSVCCPARRLRAEVSLRAQNGVRKQGSSEL